MRLEHQVKVICETQKDLHVVGAANYHIYSKILFIYFVR